MSMIDDVNNAKTEHEHFSAQCWLWGWRKGVRDAGYSLDLTLADLEQFSRGFKDRPMCCGVFNDWKPECKKGETK